jgi:fructokinase
MAGAGADRRRRVAVIGDALVDVLVDADGERAFPGGAGLNVAVGVARHGVPTLIAYPAVMDELGTGLRAFLDAEGVEVLALPAGRESAVARSWSVDGETQYAFSEAAHLRRFDFPEDAAARIKGSAAVAVSSFPMGDLRQVDALLETVQSHPMPVAVDANARASLLPNPAAYCDGFKHFAAAATLVKVSLEDLDLLFDHGADAAVGTLRGLGPAAVVVTNGAHGATVHAGDVTVHASPPTLDRPVVSTIGAGDALFASLVCRLGTAEWPDSAECWQAALAAAVAFAAAACRVPGGVPPRPISI